MKQKTPEKKRPDAPPVPLPVQGSRADLDQVAARAYKSWEKDGRPYGSDPSQLQESERDMMRDSSIQADTFRRKARGSTHSGAQPAAGSGAKTGSPPSSETNHNEIAARAAQLWEAGGRLSGRDQDYWLEAEREINERKKQTSTLDIPTAQGTPEPTETVDRHDLEDQKHHPNEER